MNSKTVPLAALVLSMVVGCVDRKGANPDASGRRGGVQDGGGIDGPTGVPAIPPLDVSAPGTGGSSFGVDAFIAGSGGSSGTGFDATIPGSGGFSGSGDGGVDAPSPSGTDTLPDIVKVADVAADGDDASSGGDVALDVAASCGTGYHSCNGTCVSNSALATCGPTECLNACQAPAGGTVNCDGTRCVQSCPASTPQNCNGRCIAEAAPCAGKCLNNGKYCAASDKCIGASGCCSIADCPVGGVNTVATCLNDTCGLACALSSQTLCGTQCADLSSDSNNCRTCGNKCGTSLPKCLSGICVECLATGDCSGNKVCSGNHCVAPLACGDPLPVVTFPTVYVGSGTAPSPVGGAVTEGVYLLTKYTCYASGLVGVSGGAFQLQNGAFHHNHTSYTTSGSAMTGYEEIGTYAISGAAMATDVMKCGTTATAQKLWRYSASPTQIESFVGSAPDICVETYTLQP